MTPNMRLTHNMCQAHALDGVARTYMQMHHMCMERSKALGLALRARRKAAHLTQPVLSERSGVDQTAISRIERGTQGMTLDTLDALAEALGVRSGQLQLEADSIQESGEVGDGATAYQLTQLLGVRHVPLISWVQAGNFAEAVDSYARGTGKRMIQTSAKVGRLAYALEVHGPSMTNPRDDRRSFPQGSVIIVDPSREYESGSLIIARLDNESEATFKQYFEDAGTRMLIPLNPQFPSMPIDKPITFCGLVVAKAEETLAE